MSEGKMSAGDFVQRLTNLRDYCISADHGTGAFTDDIRAVDQMLAAYATLQREADVMREALEAMLLIEPRDLGHVETIRAYCRARAALNGSPQATAAGEDDVSA